MNNPSAKFGESQTPSITWHLEAPIDPDTGRHKTYFRFDAFIRTCLLRELP